MLWGQVVPMWTVEEVFDLPRGVVITFHADRLGRGQFAVGVPLLLRPPDGSSLEAVIGAVEVFRVCFGDPDAEPKNVGLLLSGVVHASLVPRGTRFDVRPVPHGQADRKT